MKKLSITLLLLSPAILFTACGDSEYDQCKAEASQYWDAKATGNNKSDNPKYWAAIERCKQKYKL